MIEAWVLIVLVAGNWLAYPISLHSKDECEKGYGAVAEVFEEQKQSKPDHICARIVPMPEDEKKP